MNINHLFVNSSVNHLMMKKGDKGSDVKRLQKVLNLPISGVFDEETERYVKMWQRIHFLNADGIVGPETLKKMGMTDSEEDKIRKIIGESNLTAAPNRNNPNPTVFSAKKHVIVVAVRGYYLDMGEYGRNDRKIYDDVHFLTTPTKMIKFPGNTDPNGYRKGSGTGDNKGMACLDTGVWFFGKGPHKGRPAFRQACPFRVIRDGDPPYSHTGYHAINWHDGGETSTSSLGCQTNKPSDFRKILEFMYRELDNCDNPRMYLDSKDYGFVRAFPYILIEEKEMRAK